MKSECSQNGVKRRGYKKSFLATRSTYASDGKHRVKGHRAGRLYNFNSKRVVRDSQCGKNYLSQSDENLISKALSTRSSYIERTTKSMREKLEYRRLCHGSEATNYNAELEVIPLRAQHEGERNFANDHPELMKAISERKRKRYEFLKRKDNKICYVCGARGHVAKECASVKKAKRRAARTMAFKRHLAKKQEYRVDVDAAYVKLNEENQRLTKLYAKAQAESRNLKIELDTVKSQCNIHRKDSSEDVKLTPRGDIKSMSKIKVCGFSLGATPREVCYKWDFIPNLCTRIAHESQNFISSHARLFKYIAIIIALLSLVSTKNFSPISMITQCTNITMVLGYSILNTLILLMRIAAAMTCGLVRCLLWSKLVLACITILTYIVFSSTSEYAEKKTSWDAMSMYRTALRESGYTGRLPYKTSQLGTQACPGTSKEVYRQCYIAVSESAGFSTAVCTFVLGILSLLRKTLGLVTYLRCYTIHLCRVCLSAFAYVFRQLILLISVLAACIIKVIRVILQILFCITLFCLQFYWIFILIASIYIMHRIYVLSSIWFIVSQAFSRASDVLLAGMMTLNKVFSVGSSILRGSYHTIHGIIDTLVKNIVPLMKIK